MKPGHMDYKANCMLINDTLLDLSHLAYVHGKTFGAPLQMARTKRGLKCGPTSPDYREAYGLNVGR